MNMVHCQEAIQTDSTLSICPGATTPIAAWHTNSHNDWQKDEFISSELHKSKTRWDDITGGSQVCIVAASANKSRLCPVCKQIFSTTFGIPNEWWSDHCQNSNGYFGAEHDFDKEDKKTTTTWAFFETKQMIDAYRYQWLKINVFSRWTEATNQTVLILFDLDTAVMDHLLQTFKQVGPDCLADPFWPYIELSGEVARLQDTAVWRIRNQVRDIETDRVQGKPEPEYRRLHDLARHAIHVSESLDVAARTLEAINAQHHDTQSTSLDRRAWTRVRQRLLFHKQLVDSLRYRSVSNEKRLQNEIQLAFNTVAQYDSALSVKIGEAAKIDSAAMKTISLLTLTFLPPTFICAIFSMSFFNYDSEGGWTVSNQFWMYWAFAVPLTLLTSIVCYKWQDITEFIDRFRRQQVQEKVIQEKDRTAISPI